MKVEDIKEPCKTCAHEPNCPIKHPELQTLEKDAMTHCEKLSRYSSYMDHTRPQQERW